MCVCVCVCVCVCDPQKLQNLDIAISGINGKLNNNNNNNNNNNKLMKTFPGRSNK